MITKKIILHNLDYNKEKGILSWKSTPERDKRKLTGKSGMINEDGYLQLKLNKKLYRIHKLIYFLETGVWANIIDHKNGIKTDNRIENLRSVTNRQNSQNTYKHRAGKLVGCYFEKCSGKWKSQIQINKRKLNLGRFKTELEAHQAYVKKLKEIECNSI